jgi:hypothetical protein
MDALLRFVSFFWSGVPLSRSSFSQLARASMAHAWPDHPPLMNALE